jgi:hypothetical protein
MNISEFWVLIGSIIDVSMSVFNLLDSAVVIDSPRFSMFDFMVAVIFLGLLMKLITWLRGAHPSGGSTWQYMMQNDGLRDIPDSQLDDSFLRDMRKRQQTVIKYDQNRSPDDLEFWRRY